MEKFEKCKDSTELSNSRRQTRGRKVPCGETVFILPLNISYGTYIAHKTATIVGRMFFTGKV